MQAPNDPTSLPRQLIVCCDGTNNTITAGVHDTNVVLLMNMLQPDVQNQILYYDPGVGTADQLPATGMWNRVSRKLERLAGLASGGGIYENIGSAYRFLAEQYRDGDQIFLFGFSRGAFTARAVAGMVNAYGLLQPHNMDLLDTLIAAYFSPANDEAALGGKRTRGDVIGYLGAHFAAHPPRMVPIHFVGVFDTVESVGLLGFRRKFTSDGMVSTKQYIHVRQALSLDEVRWSFTPRVYWECDFDEPDESGMRRSLRQRWFRGVHADIGGGYPDDADIGPPVPRETLLSDQARHWMLSEAVGCALRLAPGITLQSVFGPGTPVLHNEALASPWWAVAGLVARRRALPRDALDRLARLPAEVQKRHPYRPTAAVFANADQPVQRWRPFAEQQGQHVLMLCLMLLFLGVANAYAYAAFEGKFPLPGEYSHLLTGGLRFDAWQRTAFRAEPPMIGIDTGYAAWAVLFDFGFIAAYAWFLGWGAIRVFLGVTGMPASRDTSDAPGWLVMAVGWLPCALVACDLFEDLVTLAALAGAAAQSPLLPRAALLVLVAANYAKWLAFGLTLVAFALGLAFAATARRAAHLPQARGGRH
jgi:hypothetical protein